MTEIGSDVRRLSCIAATKVGPAARKAKRRLMLDKICTQRTDVSCGAAVQFGEFAVRSSLPNRFEGRGP
jgi:hypothetical protein